MKFKASYGNWTKIITGTLTLFFVYLVINQFAFIRREDGTPEFLFTAVIIAVVYGASYGSASVIIPFQKIQLRFTGHCTM